MRNHQKIQRPKQLGTKRKFISASNYALLLERKIDLSALLRKNRMLEIIGVDYPALRK